MTSDFSIYFNNDENLMYRRYNAYKIKEEKMKNKYDVDEDF